MEEVVEVLERIAMSLENIEMTMSNIQDEIILHANPRMKSRRDI